MKKIVSLIGVFAVVIGLFTGCVQKESGVENPPVEEKAAEVEAPVVVAGTVSTARILHGLGVPLTAIPTTQKELPAELKALPTVGSPMSPDIELVKSFNPDFFVTDAGQKEKLGDAMKAQSVETLFVETSSYDAIVSAIETLGAQFDKEEAATEMVEGIRAYEDEALKVVEGKEPVSVAIIFGTPENFMFATPASFVGDLANRLGAVNIAGDVKVGSPYVPFSLETLAEKDPDYILRLTHVDPAQSKQMFDAAFAENAFYSTLKAVKNEQVVDLDPALFGVVATIDGGEALLKLAEILYGE